MNKTKLSLQKLNSHIRKCHIQKTQPLHTAKKKRGRESMVYKMTISKRTPQTIIKNENLRDYRLGTVSGKNNLPLGV
jgi:hypothetical protein